jgi:uncharacterized protein YjeT (DUF2065 family)
MGGELLTALALVLVLEGILPFLSPRALRDAAARIAQLDDRALRIIGLVSMLAGVLLIYCVH